MGEAYFEALRVGFDSTVRLAFHGSTVSSDGGLLAYRDLDETLGLTILADEVLVDQRTGCNNAVQGDIMKTPLLVVILVLRALFGAVRAVAPATQPAAKPIVVTGTLGKPQDVAKIAAVLGHSGVLFVRSEARWDELGKLLPGLTPGTPLPRIDFVTQHVVLAYRTSCRPVDEFSLVPKLSYDAKPPEIEFHFRWDMTPMEKPENPVPKFILAIIPATPTAHVAVSSSPNVVARPGVAETATDRKSTRLN